MYIYTCRQLLLRWSSRFLHYLKLASHELAIIGINVTKNQIPNSKIEKCVDEVSCNSIGLQKAINSTFHLAVSAHYLGVTRTVIDIHFFSIRSLTFYFSIQF